jgi:excisionase family DNA binding protein
MTLFDEAAFRAMVAEEVRRVLREEMQRQPDREEYLPVAEAARIAAVVPDTIRTWIRQGRLTERWAGRELRVIRSELDRLLATPATAGGDPTPEEEARRYVRRREKGGG